MSNRNFNFADIGQQSLGKVNLFLFSSNSTIAGQSLWK